ncbi:unnamed protein product [Ilex paraguariensis]|uniref:Uncharacterized protein n=1 Tax=Ilex paraguariensis TaxID=185542 RepID=A0ABC8SB41_9AQUA
MTMNGSKLSEAREVTHELGDGGSLSDERGEMQEAIDIGEEIGNDEAISVKAGITEAPFGEEQVLGADGRLC